jgi:HEAT repeat protein
MSHLDRAISAAEQGMWSIVIDCLQNMPLDLLEGNMLVLDLALQVVSQGDLEQQWQIAKIIPKLGEIAIQPLLGIVNDPDIDLEDRWCSARILGQFTHPQIITALIEIIRHNEDEELTAIATSSLTTIGKPAIAALTALLNAPERDIAVTILAQIRHSQTIEPLLQTVDDPDPQIRTLSVEALGSFHDRRIPPILLSKLTDVAASVRKAAVIALSLRGDLVAELALSQHLRPLLYDINLTVCQATALGLSRLPDPETVKILTEVLLAPHTPDDLRSPVILALSWIGTRAAIDSLMLALVRGTSTNLATAIAIGIGKIATERIYASQQLVAYLYSHDNFTDRHPAIVRQEIAAALGNLGNIATVPDLRKLVADPDDRVKLHAIAAIAKLSPTITQESLT